ncbi:PDZ domain-containing protein [Demequina sp. NBRC 110053]|uniref:YlbL family protein n=1 Tax=Demequina sp. NBRC 110053 TaxID=1570342 RepID=UPI001184827E|nr:S16 family serine protease [Demequina sp. NBRC 110053]
MTLPPDRPHATGDVARDAGRSAPSPIDGAFVAEPPQGDREPAAAHGDDHDGGAPDRRSLVMSVTGLGASVLIAVLSILPAAYAIGGPGPTYDTLGESDGVEVVEISGAPTFPASGELRLTTVSVARASSTPFTLGRVLREWASSSAYVVPEEEVFGTPDQEEQFEEQAQQDWITSQEAATVAALEALDQHVPAELDVALVDESSNAAGLLEPGDRIVSLDGVEVDSYAALIDGLRDHAPGDDVTVGYVRAGVQGEATFATLDDGAGNAIMGIYVDPTFDIPIDVTVNVAEVSGPSAGLMFSLGIIDKLTEVDELSGAAVAGTGTIDVSGDVGPIGGIRMKMYGAQDAGASAFLAPVENCDEVAGNVPDGLDVYSVDTLDDAYEAVQAIGAADTAALPTCDAP